MLLPQVGHCPSCAPIASVASRRLEQYPQLNPYRRPPERKPDICPMPLLGCCCGRGGAKRSPPPPVDAPADPAPTVCICMDVLGTRNVVEHVGHLTNCPTCVASADSGV